MSREWRGQRLVPDRLMMPIVGASEVDCRRMAQEAVRLARLISPKSSGQSSANLEAIWGDGWFGIHWKDDHVWFQEDGIQPFTMRSLAGKTIPMWINDPTGEVRRKNPKAQVRIDAAGKTQVKIFRKVAKVGESKSAVRRVDGVEQVVQVPRSYPGAAGRIGRREAGRPLTTPGKIGGAIARRNIGVRWRHPGIVKRGFLRYSLTQAAVNEGFRPGAIRDSRGRFR